jgi:hypothetical protein
VSLSGTGLPIRKDAHVEAIDWTLDQPFSLFENLLLCGVRVKDWVEDIFIRLFAHEGDCELVENLDDIMSRLFSLKLTLTQGSDSAEQPDSTLHIFELVM